MKNGAPLAGCGAEAVKNAIISAVAFLPEKLRALSITAFIGIVALGVLAGIAVAVALLIGNVFRRAWWPYQTTLGRAPEYPDSTT